MTATTPPNKVSTRNYTSAFLRFAQWSSVQIGRPHVFVVTCFLMVVWAVTGPIFGYSDSWQLIANTTTTLVTTLVVLLIQATQNIQNSAILLKLDELIRANHEARNQLVGLEDRTEEEIARVKAEFAALASGPARDARGRFVRARSS